MEVEDRLRSSCEKGECEHLPLAQWWGKAPVPTAFHEETPALAMTPEGAPVLTLRKPLL